MLNCAGVVQESHKSIPLFSMRIWKCPKILIIHFKRFKSDHHGIRDKLHHRIKLNQEITVNELFTQQRRKYWLRIF